MYTFTAEYLQLQTLKVGGHLASLTRCSAVSCWTCPRCDVADDRVM